jgi:hypothetical protein
MTCIASNCVMQYGKDAANSTRSCVKYTEDIIRNPAGTTTCNLNELIVGFARIDEVADQTEDDEDHEDRRQALSN